MNLRDKVVLVTGGAVRIGRAICLELLDAGAQIYCHYHKSEQAARLLKQEYPQVHLLQADLSETGVEKRLIGKILEQQGKIDVLVNNAAVFIRTPLGNVDEAVWQHLFDLNLKAGFFLSQEAGKHMQTGGGGKIINIADVSGLKPFRSYLPYSMTKSAVINMTKGLARALAPEIQVNGINPGPVLLPEHYSPGERKKATGLTLLKREGRAEDIAFAVRYLLEDGDYLTGIMINVDGGRSLL